MKKTILEFSGIRPVRVHEYGPVHSADAQRKQRWLEQARKLGVAAHH